MCLSKQKGDMKTVCGCPSGRTPRFLQPCILLLLFKSRSHGYEIIEKIKKSGFSETEPDAGAIYRTLRNLEKGGFVSSQWDTKRVGAARRNYNITPKGKAILKQWARSIESKKDSLNRFLMEYRNIYGK